MTANRKKVNYKKEDRMKNKIVALMATLLLAVALTGFAGGQKEGTTASIKFLQMEYDNQVVPYMQEVAKKFQAENPGINVEIVSLGWDKGHETLLTWIKGKQVPDVGNTAQRWIAEWDSLGALEPLDAYISADTLQKIPEHYLATGMYKDQRTARQGWKL